MFRQFCLSALIFCVVSAVQPLLSIAQVGSTSWDSLPEETLVGLRIPNGRELADAIHETKFGSVMLSAERKAAVVEMVESEWGDEWAGFQGWLEEYELTTDQLFELLAGESGYAVVMAGADDPLFAGLAWMQPGDELAGKIYALIEQGIEEQDEEHPIVRVDLTLAGQAVMHLQLPSVEVTHDDELLELDDEYYDLPEEEQGELWEEAYGKWEESAVETVVYYTVLFCQHGDRLLIAHGYEAEDEEAAAATALRLGEVLGQWIADHETGAEGFVQRLGADAGVARVMALEGLPSTEILGDVAPLVKVLQEKVSLAEEGERWFRMIGLESLGPFAMRGTVEGSVWRTQAAFSVPAPRQGFMQLLDQEALDVDPPQWVPASVVRYYQLSFDLAEAYRVIKETALAEFPEEASSTFEIAEIQVQNFAQASLSEVLGSLGKRHTIMSFGVDLQGAEAEDAGGQERMAIVWQLEDEELWSRLLKAITPFAKMAPGAEFAEEQGFSGWRMKNEKGEGGLFLGNGYLVLGNGSGVVETVLSSLNNPPSGSNTLAGSKLFERGADMIDLTPALVSEITDGGRYMSMVRDEMVKQLDQYEQLLDRYDDSVEGGFSEGGGVFLSLLRSVIPSTEEMEGIIGVIVSRWEINDDGVFFDSAQVMPGH